MFETLSDRLNDVFQNIGKKGKLTEADVDEAMREVRRALLEADVNFKVVKDFVSAVRERAVGEEVLKTLTPAQTVISIVNEELIRILGSERVPLTDATPPPTIIMLVGLQGSGKTTHVAKLASHLRKEGKKPLLVAADVYRPAAIQQLETLGRQINVPVFAEGTAINPVEIARHGIELAQREQYNPVIVDTAGRLQIDERMMEELEQISSIIHPTETLLVADAMTGQEAVSVAQEFHRRLDLSGMILTKMDGDARGGAALSIRSVVGVPIKFIGTGEQIDALEPFYPDRLAGRILGMGDVLSLIERAQEQISEEEGLELQEKVLEGSFDLEDFLNQLQQIKRMGPLTQILEMIPGVGQAIRQQNVQIGDDQFKHVEAIIHSMTRAERHRPEIIKPSRRRRIAKGSGTTEAEVNQLLAQFRQMQKMMQQLGAMGMGPGAGKRGKIKGMKGLLKGNPFAGMDMGELEAMMQDGDGALPAGRPMPVGAPQRGLALPPKHSSGGSKKSSKKKSKGRRR